MSDAVETHAQRLRIAMWIGAAGAALAAFAGMFGFHDASVWRMPRTLELQIESALQRAGHPGLDVTMNGQQAIVRGIVSDRAAIETVGRTALRAAGPGGAWSGGVTSVNTRGVTVGAIERPFAWRIYRDAGDRIVLSGAVPSAPSRAALMAAAAASFPNAERVDDMRVVGGAPSSNWTDMARSVIRAFALLNQGEARMIDRQVAIIGDGTYQAVDRLRRDYAAPVPPFQAQLAVSADGLDLAYPELQGVNLTAASARACNEAFRRIAERGAIVFEPASAAIDANGLPALNAVASIALRCDRNILQIAGPADGGAALSLQRAEAVANYLSGAGVLRGQVRAVAGAGRNAAIAVIGEAPR